MGAVYLARDERLQRDVALKVLLHGALAGQEELARFRVEATATAGLSHPGIVQLYEAGEHDGLRYLVMEYVEGEPLDQWMARDRIPRQRVIELVAGMADALDAAHQQGVIHRDVKPSNVVVDPVGHPRSRRAVVLVLVARGSA